MNRFEPHTLDDLRERETAAPTWPKMAAGASLSILSPASDLVEVSDAWLDAAQAARFTAVLAPTPTSAPERLKNLATSCRQRGLMLMLDMAFDRFAADHPLVQTHPDAFDLTGQHNGDGSGGLARPRLFDPTIASLIWAWASEKMVSGVRAGVGGFRLRGIGAAPPGFWRTLVHGVRRNCSGPPLVFVADTLGVSRAQTLALEGCGFDYVTSSLGWWDGRARWLIEEYEDLQQVAPILAAIEVRQDTDLTEGDSARPVSRPLALAAALGPGRLVTLTGEALSPGGLTPALAAMNQQAARLADFTGEVRVLTGPGAPVTALLRGDARDVRNAAHAVLVLINPSPTDPAALDATALAGAAADFAPFQGLDGEADPFSPLAPEDVRFLIGQRAPALTTPPPPTRRSARAAATRCPRLVIEGVTPRVDGGDFAVRRLVGETVGVEAEIFADGHGALAAALIWTALGEDTRHTVPMTPLGQDRWRGDFPLPRVGRYRFAIEAWLDRFGGFRHALAARLAAKQVAEVDLLEGRELIEAAARRSHGDLKAGLDPFIARLDAARDQAIEARAALYLKPELQALMQAADDRPHLYQTPTWQSVDAERLQARFASWYELFPRSQTDDPARHGTFDDVIERLPAIRAMGFDVLYFPPIHPIGEVNRKGPNNALTAGLGDPGSPYAIGSAAGGHDAIHPELGGVEGFRRLVAAAAEQGLEIALDFAVQCAPDHPWIKDHPNWFDWRPDGSLKYAENPPKKYEDIVNVDFYAPGAVPELWVALRNVLLTWIGEGVRLFRVDNPHTKPLPFWAWLIEQVRSAHPDVVFLAEAFTRPKLMYQLAKVGFSQSYSYFTWRNSKAELTDYFTELTTTEVREFYRPHLFVNTPDINPFFLQTGGRAAFLIRAALAATLSGLWGVYSGFERLEAAALPGREEYLDSEKYQIRVRTGQVGGDISAQIAQLNRLRRGYPALQTHLGVRFYQAFNDNILYFGKAAHFVDGEAPLHDLVLTAVSLDPHAPQSAEFELPLWEWGLPDDGALAVEDLIWGTPFVWRGKRQTVHLTPEHPYAIWCVKPLAAES